MQIKPGEKYGFVRMPFTDGSEIDFMFEPIELTIEEIDGNYYLVATQKIQVGKIGAGKE